MTAARPPRARGEREGETGGRTLEGGRGALNHGDGTCSVHEAAEDRQAGHSERHESRTHRGARGASEEAKT